MNIIRRFILAAVLMAGLTPAIAQVPPPVPALPDTERRTSYSITASTCSCNVNFALYGDGTDYANWVEVWVNDVLIPASGNWTITSPSGSLGSLARPITNAVLTFTAAQTGTVQIVGARRPRRTAQFAENTGVSARNLNQVFTDIISQNRELWDKTNDFTGRGFFAAPGHTGGVVSGPLTGVISGPANPGDGNLALWNGTSGAALKDGGHLPFSIAPAKCDGVTDDTATIATAISSTPSGGTLALPPGRCLISGSGAQIFTVTLPINIVGAGSSANGGTGTVLLLAAGVPSNRDIFHIVGVTNIVERGYSFKNFGFSIVSGSGGQNVFHFDSTAGTTTGFAEVMIDNIFAPSEVSAGGTTVLLNNGTGVNTNGGTFNFTFQNSFSAGGLLFLKAGDTLRILNNIITGPNAGISSDQVAGAGQLLVSGNNITSTGGSVIIASGIAPIVQNNELEQIVASTEPNNAIIDLTGSVGNVSNAKIVGNQVQNIPGVTTPIRVANATGTVIDNNRIGTPSAYAHIVNTAAASGTVIGAGNVFTGGGANISDSGTGTVYVPAFAGPLTLGTGVLTALGINVGTVGSFVVNGGPLGTPSSGTLTNATGLPISTGLTGAGTGVLTALGVNVGTAGAFVVNGGALGTPSSGVATNLTGTAAGLTAGNVTTNANLTGVVTSVGNATSFAASPIFTGTLTVPIHVGGSAVGSTLTLNGTSNGSPASAFLNLQSNGQFVSIGNTSPKTRLDINANLSSSPALVVATSLQRLQAPDATAGGMEWVSYGAAPQNFLSGVIAGGTSASPTATPAASNMFNLSAYGYNGTSFQKGGIITIHSFNLWSGTDQSSQIDMYTTPAGSTTIAQAIQIWPSGGFSVGQFATDPGLGGIITSALIKSTGQTAGVGYATGAGGAITQITSRTTGVTLNTVTGGITLFSAAGSATPATFTVTNSAVAATDIIKVVQKSGTDLYEIFVTNVAAGSFKITFFTTGGTTTEQPVFNFAIIKGVASFLLERDIDPAANDNTPAFMDRQAA